MATALDMEALRAYLSEAYPDWQLVPKDDTPGFHIRLHFECPSSNPAFTLRQNITVDVHPDDKTPQEVERTTLYFQNVCLGLLIQDLLMQGQFPDEVT